MNTTTANTYERKENLVFPLDVKRVEQGGWMTFVAIRDNAFQEAIILPTPPNLSFSTNLAYNDVSLGIIEGGIEKYDELRSEGNSMVSSLIDTGKNIVGNTVDKARAKNDTALQAALTQQLFQSTGINPFGPITNAAGIFARRTLRERRRAINPNTELYFQDVGLRSFNFQFRLVPKSQKESDMIQRIIRAFESASHPSYTEGNSQYVFNYPDEFFITFYEGDKPNDYIPSINKCVITNFTHEYNKETNAFFEGGAPISVDISISFRELEVNTKNTINRDQTDTAKTKFGENSRSSGSNNPPKQTANSQVRTKREDIVIGGTSLPSQQSTVINNTSVY